MDQIDQITSWISKAIPAPTERQVQIQLGVHIEEFCEMLDSIGAPCADLRAFSNGLKDGSVPMPENIDRLELLDSLVDQIVTATGVGYMFKFDMFRALNEVIRSNNSKFEDGKPVFDANGKITKGRYYSAPNLVPYL